MMPIKALTLLGEIFVLRRPRDPVTPPSKQWIHENFHWPTSSESLMSSGWALAIFAILIGFLIALKLFLWYRKKDRPTGPMIIFYQICKQVGLSLQSQWLLIRIAKQQSLSTPLTLLVCHATLSSHAQAYAQSLPVTRRGDVLMQVVGIQYKLFGK